MLRTLAFLSTKGGCGKSLLSLHTAVAALEDGARVVIADTDPQASIVAWQEARQAEHPAVVAVSPTRIAEVQQAARDDGMSLLIIDGAPHADAAATRLARCADLVVLPVRPNAIDLAAIGPALDIVQAAGARALFVLSACPPRAPEIEQAREALADSGYPIAPCIVTERRAFARAFASGRAVTEFASGSDAAAEIRALWRYFKEVMNGKGKASKRAQAVRKAA